MYGIMVFYIYNNDIDNFFFTKSKKKKKQVKEYVAIPVKSKYMPPSVSELYVLTW